MFSYADIQMSYLAQKIIQNFQTKNFMWNSSCSRTRTSTVNRIQIYILPHDNIIICNRFIYFCILTSGRLEINS